MKLKVSQSQAKLIKEALKSYNTELLTSGQDWRDYDKLFEKLADLSDTRDDADFYNDPYESPAFEYKQSREDPYEPDLSKDQQYWIDKHNPWKNYNDKRVYNAGDLRENKQRVGKDMDLL